MPQPPRKPPNDECNLPDSAQRDIAERSYYYDDAHGYESYDPDSEEGDDKDDETEEPGVLHP